MRTKFYWFGAGIEGTVELLAQRFGRNCGKVKAHVLGAKGIVNVGVACIARAELSVIGEH